jgi:hypothetical protein
MAPIDKDLRHRATPARAPHRLFPFGAPVRRLDFAVVHAPLVEKPLGTLAVGAPELGVDLDFRHAALLDWNFG